MPEQKGATKFTEAANNRLLGELNWGDTQDFELARPSDENEGFSDRSDR